MDVTVWRIGAQVLRGTRTESYNEETQVEWVYPDPVSYNGTNFGSVVVLGQGGHGPNVNVHVTENVAAVLAAADTVGYPGCLLSLAVTEFEGRTDFLLGAASKTWLLSPRVILEARADSFPSNVLAFTNLFDASDTFDMTVNGSAITQVDFDTETTHNLTMTKIATNIAAKPTVRSARAYSSTGGSTLDRIYIESLSATPLTLAGISAIDGATGGASAVTVVNTASNPGATLKVGGVRRRRPVRVVTTTTLAAFVTAANAGEDRFRSVVATEVDRQPLITPQAIALNRATIERELTAAKELYVRRNLTGGMGRRVLVIE